MPGVVLLIGAVPFSAWLVLWAERMEDRVGVGRATLIAAIGAAVYGLLLGLVA